MRQYNRIQRYGNGGWTRLGNRVGSTLDSMDGSVANFNRQAVQKAKDVGTAASNLPGKVYKDTKNIVHKGAVGVGGLQSYNRGVAARLAIGRTINKGVKTAGLAISNGARAVGRGVSATGHAAMQAGYAAGNGVINAGRAIGRGVSNAWNGARSAAGTVAGFLGLKNGGNIPFALWTQYYRQGGTIRPHYFLEGGEMVAGGDEDMIGLLIQGILTEGQSEEVINQIAQSDLANEIIQAIAERAQLGDEAAQQATEIILLYVQAAQLLALVARHGAKLNYIKTLLGLCPQGYKMSYFKAGGRLCSKCTQA